MDTRRVPGTRESFLPAAELGHDMASASLVELVELRYAVVPRGRTSLGTVVPAIVLTGVVAAIALFAVATRAGWSVLNAY
jgi:hypothetical protein